MARFELPLALLRRELRERYLSTFAGMGWVLITPVLLLAIYAFVFVELLGARFGSRVGENVIAFLALGMWPWHAFSDAVSRGATSLSGNAALLGQISLPRAWLIMVPSLGAALIHAASFLCVLLALVVLGKLDFGGGWFVAGFAYVLIIANALALGLLLAPLNVFFRDIGTLLPQLLTFWMLLTPIFFDRSQLRSDLSDLLALNPMTPMIEAVRDGLLHNQQDWSALALPGGMTLAFALLAWAVSRRFLGRIEDFL